MPTNYPPYQQPIVDARSRLVTQPWQQFFLSLAGVADVANAYLVLSETTAPAAPAANQANVWLQDNGAGKSQLMIQFATGAAIQLAIEP